LIPTTDIVKKFEKNHRTINRRLSALKDEGLLQPLIKKTYTTLYWVREQEEN
jgi:predicted HTH transcriptional regulator